MAGILDTPTGSGGNERFQRYDLIVDDEQ